MKPCVYQPLVAFLLVTFFVNLGYAQKAQLKVAISGDRIQPNSQIDFSATYTLGTRKLPPATFAVVLKENNGDGIWQMRWPMLDGKCDASIVFPPLFPKGKYTFYFAVQPRFFRLYGQVLYPPNIKSLDGEIYVEGGSRSLKIPVKDGAFEIRDLLFENSAIFKVEHTGKIFPAIALDAWLDSAFVPAASAKKEITIGLDSSIDLSTQNNTEAGFSNALPYFDPFYYVKVLHNMTDAQKFDSVYVSDYFKINILKQFDCLSDSELVKSVSLDAFLKKYYFGFKMDRAESEDQVPTATSKDYEFILYLNEKPSSFGALDKLKLSDIATIKILPPKQSITPPFKKYQSIIALYTRQGPYILPDPYRHNYIINGYQPPIYAIPLHSKFFAYNSYYLF